MGLMCSLYGHQWHHAGTYEVIVRDDGLLGCPFECTVCGNESIVEW